MMRPHWRRGITAHRQSNRFGHSAGLLPWKSRCRFLLAWLAVGLAGICCFCSPGFLMPRLGDTGGDLGAGHPQRAGAAPAAASSSRRHAAQALSVLLLQGFAGAALPAHAADVANRNVAPWGLPPMESMLLKLGKDLGIPGIAAGNSTQAQGGSAAGVDSNTTTALVGLGVLFFVVVPILKFIVTGFVTLYIVRDTDQRFSTASGQKPTKALDRFLESISGGVPDALEERRLRVWRLNDELASMQIAISCQVQGNAASKVIREAARQDRELLAWRGVLGDLDLTPEERRKVGAAFAKFVRKDSVRRDEVTEVQVGYTKRLTAGSWIPIAYERLRIFWESEKQFDFQKKLYSELADALPKEKAAKLTEILCNEDDPMCIEHNAAVSPQIYVIAFDGDLGASRVQQLQMEVTAILMMPVRPSEVVVLLRSAGGTVPGYGLAAAQLMRLRDHGVHVVACVDEVAASGGYLMACCANKVLCAPFAAIGSIGVISGTPNAADRLEREGIEVIETTAGKWKRTVTPYKSPSEDDLAKAKADIRVVYNQFAGFVKDKRPAVNLDTVATGEIWFGAEALAKGLVDEVSTSAEYLLRHSRKPGCEILAMDFALKPTGLPALFAASLQGAGADSMSSLTESFAKSFADGFLGAAGVGTSSSKLSWPVGVTEPRFQSTDDTGTFF